MCGISAVLDPSSPPDLLPRLLRMHAPIRHRGPDGEGFLLAGHGGTVERADVHEALAEMPAVLGLAFRRLRILDLSPAAAQPMGSADGAHWILFNGEIYNYRELRSALEAGGRVFHSSGDTEVALAAFEAWGEDAFARLDGMWAIVVADLRRRRLVLSRDRFGIKPLYWALDEGALLVGSEIRQLLAARRARPRAHAPLVHRYLAGSRYPCLEETFFEGVRAVPPATWCAMPMAGPLEPPLFHAYWRLDRFSANGSAPDYGTAREQFGALLDDAVRSHTVADVRLGSLLSGGLDSSALASLLGRSARESGRTHPTFSFGVPGTEGCELELAAVVARAHALPNHRAGIDAGWLRSHAAAAIRAVEEPPLALPALAQYRTFALCREHDTTVVLDGQGADEVLGGYPYHQRLLLLDRLRRGRVGAFAGEMAAIGRREHVRFLRLLGALVLPPLAARTRRAPDWLAPAAGRDAGGEERRAHADRGGDASLLNRQLYWDVKWGNVKIVLGYTDKNAMAHSVEARVPYFDRRLVEYAFTLPDHFKVGDGQRKRILRDAVRGLVPAEVTERKDRLGFALPERALVRGLFPGARAVVDGSGLLRGAFVRRAPAERLLARYEAGDDTDARSVWRLFALAVWAGEFDVALA